MSKRGSLEIGINTIVILVIAMILLTLGVGFVRSLFDRLNTLPGEIPIDDLGPPPTSQDPIKMSPGDLEIKSGESEDVRVGVYNKENNGKTFSIDVAGCTRGVEIPVEAGPLEIDGGEAKGFQIIVHAREEETSGEIETFEKLEPRSYICSMIAYSVDTNGNAETNGVKYSRQFKLDVVN